MTILKSLAAASFLLLLVPAGQAFASAPHDVGQFQTQCMALGGDLQVATGLDAYSCNLDGQIKTCEFGSKTPSCVEISGPVRHRQDSADNLGDPTFEWTHRTYTPDQPHEDLQPPTRP